MGRLLVRLGRVNIKISSLRLNVCGRGLPGPEEFSDSDLLCWQQTRVISHKRSQIWTLETQFRG